MNVVNLMGYLAQDAEMRMTANGLAVATFAVAVNERRQTDDGWEDRPSFVDCTMYGKRAAGLHPYLTKGTGVAVTGHLRQDRWETEDGKKRSRLIVIVDAIDPLPRREKNREEESDE